MLIPSNNKSLYEKEVMTARALGDFRVLGVDEQDTTMEDTGAGANPGY